MIEENIRNPPQQEIILISCRGNQQCTYDISHINSIKVRLEHSTDCAHHKRQANFNSIKVRLELLSLMLSPQCRAFQFHKGTIRTTNFCVYNNKQENFNSIKVRLEHSSPQLQHPRSVNFNSIKVRLERSGHHACIPTPPFQFHKGTIRTEMSVMV